MVEGREVERNTHGGERNNKREESLMQEEEEEEEKRSRSSSSPPPPPALSPRITGEPGSPGLVLTRDGALMRAISWMVASGSFVHVLRSLLSLSFFSGTWMLSRRARRREEPGAVPTSRPKASVPLHHRPTLPPLPSPPSLHIHPTTPPPGSTRHLDGSDGDFLPECQEDCAPPFKRSW